VLLGHPAVEEAAVVGKPDPLVGQSIKAFVMLKDGVAPTDTLAAELRSFVRREVGPVAVPDDVEFVAALPKTRSGKVVRSLLKDREAGGAA